MPGHIPIEPTIARAALAGLCLAFLCSSGPATGGRAAIRMQGMEAGTATRDGKPLDAAPSRNRGAARAGVALPPGVYPIGLSGDGEPHDSRLRNSALSIDTRP